MDIEVVHVEAVLMPNKEVIFAGKTLGFAGGDLPDKFIKRAGNITITVEGGCVTDVAGLPQGWTYELNDLDNEGA